MTLTPSVSLDTLLVRFDGAIERAASLEAILGSVRSLFRCGGEECSYFSIKDTLHSLIPRSNNEQKESAYARARRGCNAYDGTIIKKIAGNGQVDRRSLATGAGLF